MMKTIPGFGFAVLATIAATARSAPVIWWEGESPRTTNFPDRTWFDPKPGETDKLSGGDWLTSDGKRGAGQAERFATYRLRVDQAGAYHLWVRKFWKHGPFRWRFDRQPWRVCGPDVALADTVTLRTHVCANWVSLGTVSLSRGEHVFELRLLAKVGQNTTACFDCFVLSQSVFVPNGKHRPGERTGRADAGRFAWEPASDPFSDEAMLDLRSMNEPRAGVHGRVRRERGHFVLGDGRAVRFWAVNVGAANAAQDRASIDYLARKLAKVGVNLVRYHSPLFEAADPARIDAKKLDDLHYLVAAMARQGIYTQLSLYFPLWCDGTKLPGVSGYQALTNKHPFALLYFDPAFQRTYRGWMKQILTPVNPYTKKSLADDPAVAIVEMVNEDSFFFWTFSRKNIPAVYWRALEKRFGRWLIGRYGSIDKALGAWGGKAQAGDDPAGGQAAVREIWHMTGGGLKQGGPAKRRRLADQVRFLAETQRRFYADTATDLRQLGYGGLTSASNWHTADPDRLDAVERYTYTAADVIDCHGYFGGKHTGAGAAYSVRVGHHFENVQGVRQPERLPIRFFQVADRPQMISELNWTQPNRYRAEAVALTAVYGALQGCDAIDWFAVGNNFLSDRSMKKFAVSDPVIAGALPAAALIYRQGLVAEAGPAVDQHFTTDALFSLTPTSPGAGAALDALRRAEVPAGQSAAPSPTVRAALVPLAFYVGRVQRDYTRRSGGKPPVDLSRYIDRDRQTIRSMTGQLRWDYGTGVVSIDAPRARGLIGCVGRAGPVRLGGLTIACGNASAAVLVVSTDGRPIEQSRRLLVQVMTEARPVGFAAEAGRITALGGYPFGLNRIDCRIDLGAAWAGAQVLPLDENGYRRSAGHAASNHGGSVRLADDAVYHVIRR